MNHQDALKEMAVERYLLGELNGASLESFEEHLFECPECAADVKAGATFIDGTRSELRFPRTTSTPQAANPRSWISWFISPWILGPALAACLVVLAVQTLLFHLAAKVEEPQAANPHGSESLVPGQCRRSAATQSPGGRCAPILAPS